MQREEKGTNSGVGLRNVDIDNYEAAKLAVECGAGSGEDLTTAQAEDLAKHMLELVVREGPEAQRRHPHEAEFEVFEGQIVPKGTATLVAISSPIFRDLLQRTQQALA